jgi:hypothetical protein
VAVEIGGTLDCLSAVRVRAELARLGTRPLASGETGVADHVVWPRRQDAVAVGVSDRATLPTIEWMVTVGMRHQTVGSPCISNDAAICQPRYACAPLPAACAGTLTCACAYATLCTSPDICATPTATEIDCSFPAP